MNIVVNNDNFVIISTPAPKLKSMKRPMIRDPNMVVTVALFISFFSDLRLFPPKELGRRLSMVSLADNMAFN
jgi:hypothetical protein